MIWQSPLVVPCVPLPDELPEVAPVPEFEVLPVDAVVPVPEVFPAPEVVPFPEVVPVPEVEVLLGVDAPGLVHNGLFEKSESVGLVVNDAAQMMVWLFGFDEAGIRQPPVVEPT